MDVALGPATGHVAARVQELAMECSEKPAVLLLLITNAATV